VKKFKSWRLILIGGIAIVVALYIAYRRNIHVEQKELRRQSLDALFSKVQRKNDKALLVPKTRWEWKGYTLNHGGGRSFDTPSLLSAGSVFSQNDRHYHIVYTVQKIDDDGVTLYFKADGGPPSLVTVRRSLGTVLLPWK